MTPGKIQWIDLTVGAAQADAVRDFYQAVAGWSPEPVPMGDYVDYAMHPASGGDPVAGICHKRGDNSHLPTQWMIYITVPDVDASAALCAQSGGKLLHGPVNSPDGSRWYVIQDPAGAVATICGTSKESQIENNQHG